MSNNIAKFYVLDLMKHVFLFLSILLSISINEVFAQSQKEKNMELFRMMNDYRKLHGLSAINLNEKLQAVAEAHALDLEKYYDPTQKKCNLHSR